jgi:hypothetical protein
MLCWSLLVLLYSYFWPLCCLFFFDIRILIAPLVSSNSSCVTWNEYFLEQVQLDDDDADDDDDDVDDDVHFVLDLQA